MDYKFSIYFRLPVIWLHTLYTYKFSEKSCISQLH